MYYSEWKSVICKLKNNVKTCSLYLHLTKSLFEPSPHLVGINFNLEAELHLLYLWKSCSWVLSRHEKQGTNPRALKRSKTGSLKDRRHKHTAFSVGAYRSACEDTCVLVCVGGCSGGGGALKLFWIDCGSVFAVRQPWTDLTQNP